MKSFDKITTWVPLIDVPGLIAKKTNHSYKPTRQTIYNWVKRGWLETNRYHPLKTTRRWINNCLRDHIGL